jgi:type IV pilus assembly protein PilM
MFLDLKRLLNIGQDEIVFGLDIGSSAVKLIQMHKDKAGYAVTAAGVAEIAAGVAETAAGVAETAAGVAETAAGEGSEDNSKINTVKAISECLRSTEPQTQLVVCGVSGPEVAVRYFSFPSLPPEEIEGAVLLEAAQVCPFNVGDASTHYQLMPNGEDETSGILVAATNEVIKNKVQLAKTACLDCALMDVDGLALLNCLSEFEETKPDEAKAVLNVGGSCTTLAIMGEDSPPFIRDMTYAGNDIIEQIVTERDVSTEAVKEILSNCEDLSQLQSEFGDGFKKACKRLTVDVSETLRYYEAQQKSSIVEKIFVCGGFALVKGFVELLDNHLPAAVVLWNPFEKIRCEADRSCEEILRKNGPAMAVAAGLAMRSI